MGADRIAANGDVAGPCEETVFKLKAGNCPGSKFRGSRLPWRDLMCVPRTIAGKPGLGQGFKVKQMKTRVLFRDECGVNL